MTPAERLQQIETFLDTYAMGALGQVDSIWLVRRCRRFAEALEKIADPRKRDHREPDKYTEVGCMIHIAEKALGDEE